MILLEQHYLGCLAHASYLLGSGGVAAVVDPQRDVDIYLTAASERGLRIAHVIETHLHADFVSGHRELAEKTGGTIYLGEGSGAGIPHRAVRDGDEICFGNCRLRFLSTPGHTLESISILVFDADAGPEPWAVLTGDTLFIGDVGRPDLSETHTPQQLAGILYDSLHQKLLSLPDSVLVYPAHGAGSMCGRNISADRFSTIGRERQLNYALRPMSRDEFVRLMTADLPPRPEYFAKDVELNRQGAGALSDLPPLPALSPAAAERMRRTGTVLLDTRSASDYGAGHIPGSLNIGLAGQFAAWAGALIGADSEIVLVCEDEEKATEARMRLARIGFERVVGYVEDGVNGWVRDGRALQMTPQITVFDLREEMQRDDLVVLDVRRPAEWEASHIPGALHSPLDGLQHSIRALDRDCSLAVHCKGGYRSAIATSLLQSAGFSQVMNVSGGYDAWIAAGFPVTEGRACAATE